MSQADLLIEAVHAGLGWNRVGIATGEDYPDALAGGVLQGRYGAEANR